VDTNSEGESGAPGAGSSEGREPEPFSGAAANFRCRSRSRTLFLLNAELTSQYRIIIWGTLSAVIKNWSSAQEIRESAFWDCPIIRNWSPSPGKSDRPRVRDNPQSRACATTHDLIFTLGADQGDCAVELLRWTVVGTARSGTTRVAEQRPSISWQTLTSILLRIERLKFWSWDCISVGVGNPNIVNDGLALHIASRDESIRMRIAQDLDQLQRN